MKSFEEVYETLPAAGWLSREEARLLWDSAKDVPGDILEVGCYQGRSTVLLAALGREVRAVDSFESFDKDDSTGKKTLLKLLANLSSRGIFNVLVRRTRVEELDPFPVGFAYLDGDHTYHGTKRQIRFAQACGAAVIAIHDVNDAGEGVEVKKAALEKLGQWDRREGRLAVWRQSQ